MRTARTIAEHTGYYHVILKATGPLMLFREGADKAAFLGWLERTARFSAIDVLSYALLDNHFHLLIKVPERESVPDGEFRRRVEVLYGSARAERLFARWMRWEADGRGEEVALERDRLQRRMYDLGQFVKTLKEGYQRHYRKAHGWEGTLWRGRFKSVLVGESFAAFWALSLYIALNPVRAGIVGKGTDSPWTSFGQSERGDTFGGRCHRALLRELARLAGAMGTDSIGKSFQTAVAEAEGIRRDAVRAKLREGMSLSLSEMLVCRVHAFSNGRALGDRGCIESVPVAHKRVTPVAQCDCGLFTATPTRGSVTCVG